MLEAVTSKALTSPAARSPMHLPSASSRRCLPPPAWLSKHAHRTADRKGRQGRVPSCPCRHRGRLPCGRPNPQQRRGEQRHGAGPRARDGRSERRVASPALRLGLAGTIRRQQRNPSVSIDEGLLAKTAVLRSRPHADCEECESGTRATSVPLQRPLQPPHRTHQPGGVGMHGRRQLLALHGRVCMPHAPLSQGGPQRDLPANSKEVLVMSQQRPFHNDRFLGLSIADHMHGELKQVGHVEGLKA